MQAICLSRASCDFGLKLESRHALQGFGKHLALQLSLVLQGDVTKLCTTCTLAGGFPEVWFAVFGCFHNVCDCGAKKLSGVLGDLNIDDFAVDCTGYKDDSSLVAGYKYSTVGNFFNFYSKIHSHSVPQLTLLP